MTDWEDKTITGRLMKAMEDAIVHHVDRLIDEDSDWFNDLLDRRIDDRLRVWSEVNKYIGSKTMKCPRCQLSDLAKVKAQNALSRFVSDPYLSLIHI